MSPLTVLVALRSRPLRPYWVLIYYRWSRLWSSG